jgi:hypothetical protein
MKTQMSFPEIDIDLASTEEILDLVPVEYTTTS